jgi:hypothetical protein
MVVGKKDRIYMAYVFAEHLLAEVRSSINEDLQALIFHINACSEPLVTRVDALADLAATSYHRNAL